MLDHPSWVDEDDIGDATVAWVCVRERERERVRERARERESVCVCVCVRESVCVCVREREIECVRERETRGSTKTKSVTPWCVSCLCLSRLTHNLTAYAHNLT